MRRAALTLLLGFASAAGTVAAATDAAAGHAVILLYHHVADDTPASTSVTPETLTAHLDHLQANDYRVLPLSRIIRALTGAAEETLPARAVAITFDDAYRSVYTNAAPRLAARGLPFAVFVSTDYIDRGFGGYMNWDQLRDLEARGAEIANHSRAHGHYVHRRAGESEQAWRRRVETDIRAAQAGLERELEHPLQALAYPYGEFDPALTALTAELGLVGFGQQSGPVGPGSDLQALPRFPMASGYADIESLAEKLRTRPFRVDVRSDVGPVLGTDTPPPTLRLRLAGDDPRLDALSCFVTGQGAPEVRWIDRARGVVEVTARAPLPIGRSKYTCTAPSRGAAGSHYWYSHLWMKPPGPGRWYPD